MNNKKEKIKLYGFILLFSLIFCGCINICCIDQSQKFTKIVHMPAATLFPSSGFQTKTHNGSIEVTGDDVADCNIIATITGHASTVQAAEEVVEMTKLSFEQSGEKLIFKIDKPDNLINRSVSVSLEIMLPYKVDLELESHNGRIEIENVSGNTNAVTHNGKVSVRKVSGVTRLETHNGAIEADEISGDINFLSHNGKVEADFADAAAPDSDITMITHNGGIDVTTPLEYSARVDISTHNGSIDTELPVTVSGDLGRKHLTGIVRNGQGVLKLETHNGSIKLR
ncbi:MAG: DUF4097 family beta strand repeat protein [Sedimentisphaerales bacterium]|nr:DUF4097 family beta strand repeat protein [Sedimentisphaerales bacterium]